MKKDYLGPSIKVVRLLQNTYLLSGSPGAHSVSNSEGFNSDPEQFSGGSEDDGV